MATGTVNTPTLVPLSGLQIRATNLSGQVFILPSAGQRVRDVGYVTQDRTVRVMLWNGTASGAVLTGITTDEQADGIEWSATPLDQVEANVAQFVDITVTIDGPLEYVALLIFLSSCALDQDLTIIGNRAPHLSSNVGYLMTGHNWENGLEESLAWKTDVLIAHDRTEQRIQLRTLPRRAWDYRYLLSGAARRKFETWLSLRKTRYLFSPVWRDEERTTAPIVAGQSTVAVDTRYLDFAVHRWVAVYDGWNHMEIRTVTGVGIDYVAVDAPFTEDWPAVTTIAPCRYGVCLEQRQVTRFTEEVGEYRLRFEAMNESAMPAMESPELYLSVPLCPAAPSWVNPEESWDNKWIRLDNDTGLIEYDIQSIEPVLRREANFLVIGRPAIDQMLRFLFYCSGRLAPFWVAANDRAFELALPAAEGATAIVIASIDYEYNLAGSPARSHIELITTEGVIIRRRIMATATLPDGSEQLTLDAPLPGAVSAATLNRCAWLEQCRLDTDTIDLHWVAPGCLELTLSMVVLP
jgi:hypothetical protein